MEKTYKYISYSFLKRFLQHPFIYSIRLLWKRSIDEQFLGDAECKTGARSNTHEDPSTESTHKLPSIESFVSKSILLFLLISILNSSLDTALIADAIASGLTTNTQQNDPQDNNRLSKDALLTLPLRCDLGKDCWISNLPEHSYRGRLGFDYYCSQKTYSAHNGTDFAIQGMNAMKDGIDVIAPIDGIIDRMRDGLPDINVKKIGIENLGGKDCGNSVAIKSGDHEYILCHMKQFSLIVKGGEKLKRGQKIGQVGLSGRTEYPHLHLTVRKKDNNGDWIIVDPFYNKGSECGSKPNSSWIDAELFDQQAIKGGIVYNFGFSDKIPTSEEMRMGDFEATEFSKTPEIIVGWVQIFSTRPGDQILMRLTDTKNNLKVEQSFDIEKYQARYMKFIGKKLNVLHNTISSADNSARLWQDLKLEIEYTHKDGGTDKYVKYIALKEI